MRKMSVRADSFLGRAVLATRREPWGVPADAWIDVLARYNSERARGIMHTPEWQAEMAGFQRKFNEREGAR